MVPNLHIIINSCRILMLLGPLPHRQVPLPIQFLDLPPLLPKFPHRVVIFNRPIHFLPLDLLQLLVPLKIIQVWSLRLILSRVSRVSFQQVLVLVG